MAIGTSPYFAAKSFFNFCSSWAEVNIPDNLSGSLTIPQNCADAQKNEVKQSGTTVFDCLFFCPRLNVNIPFFRSRVSGV